MTLLFFCFLRLHLMYLLPLSTQRGLLDIKYNLVWEFYVQILEHPLRSLETLGGGGGVEGGVGVLTSSGN